MEGSGVGFCDFGYTIYIFEFLRFAWCSTCSTTLGFCELVFYHYAVCALCHFLLTFLQVSEMLSKLKAVGIKDKMVRPNVHRMQC